MLTLALVIFAILIILFSLMAGFGIGKEENGLLAFGFLLIAICALILFNFMSKGQALGKLAEYDSLDSNIIYRVEAQIPLDKQNTLIVTEVNTKKTGHWVINPEKPLDPNVVFVKLEKGPKGIRTLVPVIFGKNPKVNY